MSIETYDMDTPEIRVPVTKSGGGVFPLDGGASVEAWAKKRGQDPVELAPSITDPAGGIITVTVGADDLSEGIYTLQVRVTKEGQVQTVVEAYLVVKYSIKGAA